MCALNRKKNSSIYYSLVFLFLLGLSFPLIGQKASKNDLEERKKQLQEDIEYTKTLLSETKKNKKLSINQLLALNKQISNRQELIGMITSQIHHLTKQIDATTDNITELQAQLQSLKDDYARMIVSAYRNRDGYNRLMFIFASSNFNQAFIRLKYMQQYSDYRHQQAEQITQTQAELEKQRIALEAQKNEKKQLLGLQETEKHNLTKEKEEKEDVLMSLQSKEKQLKADLEKKRRDAEKLQQAILRIIKEEIAKANAANAKNAKSPSAKLVLTPEAQQLSSSFSNNKGKLPWPVIQGVVIDRFGAHPHPTMTDITINNNGVDIATSKGALARAVFDGEVTGVVNVPSSGQVIIIRHGEYLSVYANLNEVYVKPGDKIKTKQNLGNILLDADDAKTELHLEIWKGQTKLDPEEWLYKK